MAHAGMAWPKAGSVCSFLRDDDGAMKNFAFGFVIRVSARRAVPFPRSLARHRSIDCRIAQRRNATAADGLQLVQRNNKAHSAAMPPALHSHRYPRSATQTSSIELSG